MANSSAAHRAESASDSHEIGSKDHAESAGNDLAISDDDPHDNALDWRGRLARPSHGGVKTSFYILANQALWNLANTAVGANLVLYFRTVLQMSNASAATSVTNWNGVTWSLALVGGFMGDSYLGRFWTCVIFQVIHVLGLSLLSISVTVDALKPAVCPPTTATSRMQSDIGTLSESCPKPSMLQMGIFMVALYIIALGVGGYLPVFQALGADQLKSAPHRTTFFGWLFVSTNMGSMLANTVFVWVENQGKWALAYWVATGVGNLAFALFGLGTPLYRQFRPAGNPFKRMAQVLVASLRNWKFELPKDEKLLYELDEEQLAQRGCRKMPHTNNFRFLDKAAIKVEVDINQEEEGVQLLTTVSEWKLCYVTQVEELKTTCRMLPIFLTSIPITAIFTQVYTLFVEQAFMMDTRVGKTSFHIPPASMSVLNTLSIFVFTLIYPVVVVPIARIITRRKEGLSQLQRMIVGQVLAALAAAAAALLERQRLGLALKGEQLSILWQTPQEVILGASTMFLSVGGMNFFYDEAPHSMRGIMSSLSYINMAIGSFLSSTLVSIVTHFTAHDGRSGWIPPDLNEGHLDYFFWLLFVMTIASTIIFIMCAWWFHRTSMPKSTKLSNLASKLALNR